MSLSSNSVSKRIHRSDKLTSLLHLRNEVYQTRQVSFHWNLDQIVDCSVRPTGVNNNRQEEDETHEAVPALQMTEFNYDVGSFVEVRRHDKQDSLHFWIGWVVDTHCSNRNVPVQLSVNW